MAEAAKTPIATSAPVPMPAPTRKAQALQEMRMKGLEFRQTAWGVFAPNGTTIQDIETREFWAHVAAKLTPFAKIAVMTDDRRLYLEAVVTTVGSNWAQVHVLPGTVVRIDGDISRTSIADDFRIEDGGLQLKWKIVRVSDGRIIKGDGTLNTEDDARAWLRQYLQSQGLRPAA